MENSLYQLAEIEISYKPQFKASLRPQIDSSNLAYEVLLENWNEDKIELLENSNFYCSIAEIAYWEL